MLKYVIPVITLTLLVSTSSYAAAPSAERLASDVCAKCHGLDGAKTSPLFPIIAGQQAAYLEKQLKSFRDHERGDPHAQAYMWGVATPLTDEQIKAIASYYAKKPAPKGQNVEEAELAARGKVIYEKGVPDRSIPACIDCHGVNAEGKDDIPRLAGQNHDYLATQLLAFKGVLRESDVMDDNAKDLNEDDIAALAEYLSSK